MATLLFSGTNVLAVNVAPPGSTMTVIRTHGASNGGAITRPPSSVARAAIVTVGSLRTDVAESSNLGSPGAITVANALVGSGGAATSPVEGTIVRWHLTGAVGGPFYLRVLRPMGGGLVGVGRSAAGSPAGLSTQTFATGLPIHAGDLIGLDTSNASDKIGVAAAPGSVVAEWSPAAPEGTVSFPVSGNGFELTFNAEVQPVPKLTGLSPASGSIAGGTAVTLLGSDLGGATAVSFGGQPAAVYPSLSDTTLTAVAPKAMAPGPVDVTVTTPGGTSVAARYEYVACRVPKLKGKTLKAAKKALRGAHCKPGAVHGKGRTIIKQGLKPGTVLPEGAKVGVTKG